MMLRITFFISVSCLLFFGCDSSKEKNNTNNNSSLSIIELNYAKGFEIQQAENYKVITLKNTSTIFLLMQEPHR